MDDSSSGSDLHSMDDSSSGSNLHRIVDSSSGSDLHSMDDSSSGSNLHRIVDSSSGSTDLKCSTNVDDGLNEKFDKESKPADKEKNKADSHRVIDSSSGSDLQRLVDSSSGSTDPKCSIDVYDGLNEKFDKESKPADKEKDKELTSDDILFNLPLELRHLVFSFVNTRQMVQTCSLSPKWNSFWQKMPCLNFDRDLVRSLNLTEAAWEFKAFVDQVTMHRGLNPLQSLHISCPRVNDVSSWIHYAIDCGVQELSIDLMSPLMNCELLHEVFTCTSLKVLELTYRFATGFESFLPDQIDLPVLSTLCLRGFFGMHGFDQLFPACPMVTTLMIDDCALFSYALNISSNRLEQLVIVNRISSLGVTDSDIGGRAAVNIFGPRVTYFRCSDEMLLNYSLMDLSALREADICLGRRKLLSEYRKQHYRTMAKRILKAIKNVTTLTLAASDTIFEILSETDVFEDTEFHKLKYLKFCAICSRNRWTSPIWFTAFSCLIKVSPNLARITLIGEIFDLLTAMEEDEYVQAGITLGGLKSLEYFEYKKTGIGGKNDFAVLKNLVRNSSSLKELVVFFLPIPSSTIDRATFTREHRDRQTFCESLLEVPTATPSRAVKMRISESDEHFKVSFSFGRFNNLKSSEA